ncbi:uncharacterized protein LOC141620343 [Silene latifolia]|uniref:uncharacterized protein LOC141620343 n=1 Tax=Silene latifolia TaxID=37657 RepID=UPI003D76F6D5
MEMKEKVLASGHYLFDDKPMIVKAWERDMEMTKEDVKCVPAWIRLHKLPLKCWGKGLPKIAGIVGKHVKNDTATEERTRLGFARVMVELVVDQELPAKIAFKDEHGLVNQIEIEYEWKPIKCMKCQGMGHDQEQCRKDKMVKEKTVVKKVWILVVKTDQGEAVSRKWQRMDIVGSLLEHILTKSGYHNGGRIWILWQPRSFRVQFLEYNAQFIHMKVESLVSRTVFYLTMVYAFNGINDRAPLWGHLRRFAGTIFGPWAIAGDFNCVMAANERVGGNVPSSEMEPFRDCVADCGVLDIAATGALYTWNNKQQPEEKIYSRFDRVLSKVVGTQMFKLVKKLKMLKPALRQLNREKFSDIEHAADVK